MILIDGNDADDDDDVKNLLSKDDMDEDTENINDLDFDD